MPAEHLEGPRNVMISAGSSEAVSGMSTGIERRLTNIFSADVLGYSRLMGLDEAGTLALLNEYKGVMTRLIAEHRGRIVSTAGDSVLAEFPSSVMAVQSAVDIQRQLAERNQKLEPDRQMWFRIGINLGDVIVEGDDIFGDDVNISATSIDGGTWRHSDFGYRIRPGKEQARPEIQFPRAAAAEEHRCRGARL